MPTYDYECRECEHQLLDVFQKFADDPLTICPECGEEGLFRIVTGGVLAKVNNIDTIGKLADKNTRENRSQIEEAEAKRLEENPPPEKEWYQNPKYGGATRKEINRMTPQQKKHYIMEGRK